MFIPLKKLILNKSFESCPYISWEPVPEILGITINDIPYKNAIITRWLITNTGKKTISAKDFIEPLTVEASQGAKLLYINTYTRSPMNLTGKWVLNETKTKALLTPELLNPDENYLLVLHMNIGLTNQIRIIFNGISEYLDLIN